MLDCLHLLNQAHQFLFDLGFCQIETLVPCVIYAEHNFKVRVSMRVSIC